MEESDIQEPYETIVYDPEHDEEEEGTEQDGMLLFFLIIEIVPSKNFGQ